MQFQVFDFGSVHFTSRPFNYYTCLHPKSYTHAIKTYQKRERPILLAPGYSPRSSWNLLWQVTIWYLQLTRYCCLIMHGYNMTSVIYRLASNATTKLLLYPKMLVPIPTSCAPNKRTNLIAHCTCLATSHILTCRYRSVWEVYHNSSWNWLAVAQSVTNALSLWRPTHLFVADFSQMLWWIIKPHPSHTEAAFKWP